MTPDHRKSHPPATALEPENDEQALERRLFELETRLAHLARFVEELNEVVTEQAGRLERLERENAHLRGHAGPGAGAGPLGRGAGSGAPDPEGT